MTLGFLARPPASPRATTSARTDLRAPDVPPTPTSAPALPLGLDRITSAAEFEAISQPAGDLVANGRVAKFLVDRRDPTAPTVHFVNGGYADAQGARPDAARYHWSFAQAFLRVPDGLNEFNQVTYFTDDKRYVAGVLHTYLLGDDSSTDQEPRPVYALQFYPQDVVHEAGVLEVVRLVVPLLQIPDATFAFVPTGLQQTVTTVAADLEALGVEVLPLEQVLGAITYVPLNLGEAWGTLRIFPPDLDALRPTDIPVFDELPLALSVVAGVLTRAVQDSNSHVNLKSKERRTPNAVVRDATRDDPRLAPHADEPVHLTVAKEGFTLEPSTAEVVAAKLAERLDRPVTRLEVAPETALRSYDEMAAGSPGQARAYRASYGTKAANLAFLAHRDVLGRVGDAGSPSAERGYDLVPRGFGVPEQAYQEYVAANPALEALIDRLVDDQDASRLSPLELAARVEAVQAAFMAGSFPSGALDRLRETVEQVLPGSLADDAEVKVRSSANAEDVPDFDGAGLHDSYSAEPAKPDVGGHPCRVVQEETADAGDPEGAGGTGEVKRKVKPKSLACAVRGVYASLWNKRAVEERSFARIDHRTAAMGLAVVPTYDAESEVVANAVIVTRVLNTTDVFGYSLSVQVGNNLVTNPDPGTWSEVTIAAFYSDTEPVSLSVTRYAKPTPDAPVRTEPVLPADRMLELVDLAKRVERAYCRATPGYYSACDDVPFAVDKRASLDLEVKVLANGHLVVKQVREFGGH